MKAKADEFLDTTQSYSKQNLAEVAKICGLVSVSFVFPINFIIVLLDCPAVPNCRQICKSLAGSGYIEASSQIYQRDLSKAAKGEEDQG